MTFALLLAAAAPAADSTWVYAVQLSASVETSPPRLELTWVHDHLPAVTYTVRRKGVADTTWGEPVILSGDASSFVDESVEAGGRYEYHVSKRTAGTNITAHGYIAVGVEAPLVDDRGRMIVVVDRSVAGELAAAIAQLEQDLVGDGWTVVRHEAARDANPHDVRAAIQAEYQANPERTRAVLLLGHVPVVKSGLINIDGHGARPLPADVFYGEMDGTWTDANGDGVLEQNVLPSDVELQVGRIDFADLPGTYAASPYPAEAELLKRYLAKNHAYRHATARPAPRALVGNTVGDGNGQAYAASAYRNFSALVGAARIDHANVDLAAPLEERWGARLIKDDYLWAFGSGGGSDLSVSNLGAHGPWNDIWSSDFLDLRPKAAFYLMFGSWFGDWSKPENILRSALASPDLGLAAAWCGRPHLFFHHMGVGETIGHGIRISQNNPGTLYQNQVQRQLRSIHVALLGDPTLRLHVIAPPTEARPETNGADVVLTWKPSPDKVAGYHVYRTSGDGRFTCLTESPVGETRFVDGNRAREGGAYLVRAIALNTGPSGSYVNASQGAFASHRGTAMAQHPPAAMAGETVWMDDALPAGAVGHATPNDRWSWVQSDPAPASGAFAHQSQLAPGLHLHFFTGATTPLSIQAGDILFADVYLDPASPPRQLILTWCAEDWEHRAYWGENLIREGADNSAGHRHMGELPPTGRWIRLEVPASAVGLEGKSIGGMGFNLFDGRATWDRAGKRTP